MDITSLEAALRRPEAYPHDAGDLEVHHTHISIVFLAGPFAYKVKKPVELGFLDFRDLEARRHFCEEEVRLNRRLAPGVYLGVVPITRGEGGMLVDGEGPAVEFAVKMVRLPARFTMQRRLEAGEDLGVAVEDLGRRIAAFHAEAASGPEIARFGRFEVVAGNARENLDQSASHVGLTISETVHDRLRGRLEGELRRLRPLIERRATDRPRDTHGDLHLDHVYLFPERSPPDDLVVVDCIEFNRRFRYADPICDMAFLSMDLGVHGRRDLAGLFESAYLEASGDAQGAELLPFYRSYRAAVRGKVEGMLASEAEVESGERAAALRRARGHWLYALAELLDPLDRPGVVLVSGLPGAGKSTLARALAERFGFHVISSDRTRKALARLEPDQAAPAELDAGIYTPEWTERTYETCMAELRERLFEGERVAVDATFWSEDRRRMFLDEARAWGVRCSLLEVRASPQVVRQRMDARVDAEPALAGRREARAAVLSSSDADWRIHEAIRARWEAPTPDTGRTLAQVWTDGTRGDPIEAARSALARAGLTGAP